MLKIVDIHLSPKACGEYIVLQNHGLTTLTLRGWAVCADSWLDGNPDDAARELFIFADEVAIKPYTRVVLFTGRGESGWHPTTDGKQAYLVYWGRAESAWGRAENLHLLHLSNSRKIPTPVEPVAAGR